MKNQLSSINARVYREHEQPTVPACPEGEHTPGPWKVTGGFCGLPPSIGAMRERGSFDICTEVFGDEHALANAALIARAPDLLAENARLRAALQQLFNCVPLSVEGPDPESKIVTSVAYWRAAYDQSRAALLEGGGK